MANIFFKCCVGGANPLPFLRVQETRGQRRTAGAGEGAPVVRIIGDGRAASHAPMVGPMGGLPASEWREALQAGDYSNGRSDGQMLDRTHRRVKRRLLNCNQRAKASRYGGTYARRDIAFECDTWLNPKFKL